MKSVFDRMAAARAQAVLLRKEPVAWKVNQATMAALRQEDAIDDSDEGRANGEVSLFGLPLVVDPKDRSQEPLFSLMAPGQKKVIAKKID